METELIKAALNLGVSGLLLCLIYRLLVGWAPKFLAAQQGQAEAMAALAAAVKEGQGEQREVLLAVRVMAGKLDEVRGMVQRWEVRT